MQEFRKQTFCSSVLFQQAKHHSWVFNCCQIIFFHVPAGVTTSTLKGSSEYIATGTLEAEGFVELELEATAS